MLRLWLCAFLLTLLVGIAVQLLVLPVLFPRWHAGNGLLVGIDSVKYHHRAEDLALGLREKGWAAWRSRPSGQPLVDLLALLYVALSPTPLVMLPLNAALQATALLMLWRIVRRFLSRESDAVLCVLPMALSPTGAIWYSQILKDGFSIAGTLLFLDGWLGVYEGAQAADVRKTTLAACRCLAGALLGWLVRPYTVAMVEAAACAMLLVAILVMFAARGESAPRPRAALPTFATWLGVLLLLLPFARMVASVSDLSLPPPARQGVKSGAGAGPAVAGGPAENTRRWQTAAWLPPIVEKPFRVVSGIRDDYRSGYPDATSMIDADVAFRSVSDVLLYFPRALEIGFLAPFPGQLAGSAARPANNMMRRVATVETDCSYLALACVPITLWRLRRRVQVWLVLAYCLAFVAIYALVIPNLGSLYRVRFPYVMTLVALGLAGAADLLRRHEVSPSR